MDGVGGVDPDLEEQARVAASWGTGDLADACSSGLEEIGVRQTAVRWGFERAALRVNSAFARLLGAVNSDLDECGRELERMISASQQVVSSYLEDEEAIAAAFRSMADAQGQSGAQAAGSASPQDASASAGSGGGGYGAVGSGGD
ncbi:hypothetical protein [Pauljensenia hongkongensis]|uniref:Uncharacterized protein n=1 Tax=Pauljensenia hongkongensis TaxID=178339 RepID=A0A1D8B426_9ACTO|nr:hypothetical protein [Pauljensenia hongkongensis]AOS47892.1 hypothetical protein BH719_08640 [Pauljensenia hongkongensis]EFW09161.1 hypothetical protein HMPREF9005_1848 [Actinomyces sp. oral taxon 178 str. F0338]